MDYKHTLLMPQTKFEMRGDLAVKEVKIQRQWVFDKIEKTINFQNKNNKSFILHDGPPYANGSIHLGHALNKILKDVILRQKSMLGFYTRFIAGWDTHGLPIEHALLKNKLNDDTLTPIQKRKNCLSFALQNMYQQKVQFQRLGLLSQMEQVYVTCDLEYQLQQLSIFNKMIQKNLIYQDLKPVYWSWSAQTALADGEIIYQQLHTDALFVGCQVAETNLCVVKNDYLLIWTTTPYTLPANLAICVNPDINYARVQIDSTTYVVCALDLLDVLAAKCNWSTYKVITTFWGKQLEHTKYFSPLTNKICKVLVDHYVLAQEGTGLVHNAPGFGLEDYLVCKRYNIKPFCPINATGHFTNMVYHPALVNVFYEDANKWIINQLAEKKCLFLAEKISHNTPCDWRTKKPIIYRATKQWFVNIQKIMKHLQLALKKVKANDPSIICKIKEMIANRQEWCISRQRLWGVPICILYDKDHQPLLDKKLLDHIQKIIATKGVDIWYKKDAKYFLPLEYSAKKKYYKEQDIMDVWFDSGTSYMVLKRNKLSFPADLYFEGKDQFRGWFNSSLITSVAVFNTAPYKNLLTHGFVLDQHGNKMAKSRGNVIDPLTICQQYGADVLRLWAVNCDYSNDVRISNEIIKQNAEIYRKIRNTLFRFILANLTHFNPTTTLGTYSPFDLFVLNKLEQDLKMIKVYYKNYHFQQIIKLVNNNVIFLSSWYFDFIKDSLYCDVMNDPKRVGIQKVLYQLLDNYLRVLAPILPHTCEEVYGFFIKKNKLKSVHLEAYPRFSLPAKHKIDLTIWDYFINLKDQIYAALEQAKKNQKIKHKGAAVVFLEAKNPLKIKTSWIKEYCQIGAVKFIKNSKYEQIQIRCEAIKMTKCLRCWNYYLPSKIKNNLCLRCNWVLKT